MSAAPKPHRSLAQWIVAIAVLALVAISGAGILLPRRAHASRVHA